VRAKMIYVPFVFFSCLCLANSAQDAPKDYSALKGNWHLTGGWEETQQEPRLTLSMGVDGNKIYGDGDLQVPGCGLSFSVIGQIASDGTFVLSIPKPTRAQAEDSTFPSLSISGGVPAQGSMEWTGSFTASSMGNVKCPKLSGDFVASQLPQLDGTYSGTIPSHVGGSATGTSLNISVNMKQGIFTSTDEGEFSLPELSPAARMSHYLPLTGTITVSGFTDLPSKEITASAIADHHSRMQGDQFILYFRLEGGSTMMLTGSMTDSSERAVRALLSYRDKNPDTTVGGMGILTRR